MFNKNPYLLPQGFPSNDINSLSHHASTYLAGLTADNILFHDHDDEPSGNYLAAAAAAAGDAPVIDAAAFFNHQGFCGMNGDPSAMVNSYPRGAKRDRHSKICTAQGPRDRRVRLSIGVARRFFDLQEILGFDKPSKTLDWLLTKSKTAIKDLVQSTREKSATSSSPDQDANFENGRFFGSDSKRKLVEMSKHKASDLAKESRAKARARARERTREKMCIKKLNESQKFYGYDDLINPSSIPIQYMNNQLEFCKISGSSCCSSYPYTRAIEGNRNAILHCQPTYEAPNHEDLIQEESIVIKRKVKHPSKLGFQQNLIFSPFNQTDNWDISTSFASQSNICAILDQHKFINSTANN